MQLPLQVTMRNGELGEPGWALIRKSAEKLETFSDRITACRVTVEVPQRFPAGAPIAYNVRVDLTVPGDEIVITHQGHPELETAIQDAFDAAGRRLQDYVRLQQRGAPQQDKAEPARGWVVRLFPYEGYGFLTTPDSREIYFHRNSVLRDAFDALEVGTSVRFVEEQGEKGPQASTVVVATRRAPRAKNR
jgi:cold shock CspA family protein/ribosome-associated translation inhibitor RaiA